MTKPDFTLYPQIPVPGIQTYERYLPTAFDESLTLLEKVNKIIEYLNRTGALIDDIVNKWNEIMKWLLGEGLQDAVNEKLEEWLKDGTLENIIQEVIDGRLDDLEKRVQDLLNQVEDILKKEFGFNIGWNDPQYLFEFSGIRNAVNQYIVFDDETQCFYSTQSDSQDPEGFYINRLNPTGHFVSYMHIPGGGHGTTIGLDRNTNGDLKIWLYHNQVGKLIQVEYQDWKILSLDEAMTYTDYTPSTMKDKYFTPIMDQYHDRLCLRTEDGYVEVWDRMNVRNHTGAPIHQFQVPVGYYQEDNPMQGVALFKDTLYWQSGWGSDDARMQILEFDLNTGQMIQKVVYDKIVFKNGTLAPDDHFREPEGISIYYDKKHDKKTMFIGFTTGGSLKRYNILYAITQLGGSQKWETHRALHTQTFEFLRGTGAAKRLPDGYDDLNKMLPPGYYYLMNSEAKALKNFPYPAGDQSWNLIVTPYNQLHDRKQILTRNSGVKKDIRLERGYGYDYKTNSVAPSTWSITWANRGYGEYVNLEEFNIRNLSDIRWEGDFYLTGAQRDLLGDVPTEVIPAGNGMFLRNTEFSVGELETTGVTYFQFVKVQSSVQYRECVRKVTYNNAGTIAVTDWTILHQSSIGTYSIDPDATVNGNPSAWSTTPHYDLVDGTTGQRKRPPSGTDILTLPSGFYHGDSSELTNHPFVPNSWINVDVIEGASGRKTVFVSKSYDGALYFGTVHTNNVFTGWQQVTTPNPVWENLTLNTGVTSAGGSYVAPQVSMINNQVVLKGAFKIDAYTGGMTVATLPAQYRPKSGIRLQLFVDNQNDTYNVCVIVAQTDGQLRLWGTPAVGKPICMDSCKFYLK